MKSCVPYIFAGPVLKKPGNMHSFLTFLLWKKENYAGGKSGENERFTKEFTERPPPLPHVKIVEKPEKQGRFPRYFFDGPL